MKISTPYLKSGVLWDDFSKHYGQDSTDILVWRATSALMNPTLTDAALDGAKYIGAVDASGGGADAFTFSIVHVEGKGEDSIVVQDVLRSWRRTGQESPNLRGVVSEIAGICKAYRVRQLVGDRYGAGWVRQAFQEEGLTYIESRLDKSATCIEALPLFSTGRLRLLDHPQQTRELQCFGKKDQGRREGHR